VHGAKGTRTVGVVSPGAVTRHSQSIASPSASLAAPVIRSGTLRGRSSAGAGAVAVASGARFTATSVT
jgi:hypothetical protein